MAHSFSAIRELFERALDVARDQRGAWLQEAAAGDAGLIAEVEKLLAIDEGSSSVLDTPPAVPALANLPDDAGSQWLGRRIGSFELMAVLGRGGMGTVFEAEQERPRRRVALKVMRQAIGDEKARVRFEYEAEILARLQHPGIAQVYEASTFESDGVKQPYFAMELVDGGRPLDEYVADRKLDLQAILVLVEQVCEAVHHGHQRGVVHRDLKPANVLVDSTGQPKLIDFGIARAGGTEWQATLSSESDSVVGTLAYMAPEQLDQGGAAIDTRVDVYALGVILYQLLTGRLPLQLDGLPLGRATDVIRTQVPPRLSHAAESVAGDLPIDLDWILQKALRKAPDERYASAQALREELSRLRHGEPVDAGPPSATYLVRKFVGRNRVAVTAAAAVLLALISGTIATSIGWRRALDAEALAERRREVAERAEALAEERRQEAEQNANEMWQVAQMQFQLLGGARGDKNKKLAEVVREWSTRLPKTPLSDRVAATMHAALGASFHGLGLNDEAFAEFDRAWDRIGDQQDEMPRAVRIVQTGQARALTGTGRSTEAEPILRAALATLQDKQNASPHEFAGVYMSLGAALHELRKFEEAKAAYEAAVPLVERLHGEGHYSSIRGHQGIALCLQGLQQNEAARAAFEKTCNLASEHLGEQDPDTLSARNSFAVFLFHQGEIDAALAQFEKLHAASIEVSGHTHPATVRYASNRALCHERQQRFAEAEAIYREILAARAESGASTELADVISRFNFAVSLHSQPEAPHKREEALTVLDALLVDALELLGEDNWRVAVFRQHRGMVLRKLRRFEEAEAAYGRARAVLEEALGEDHMRTRSNWAEMVKLYEEWGRPAEAGPWRERLAAGQ